MLNLDNPVEIVLNDKAVYPARIICRDLRGEEPIAVEWGEYGFLATFRADGSSKLGSALRNRKVNRSGWVLINIGRNATACECPSIYASKEDVEKYAYPGYAVARIEWEE